MWAIDTCTSDEISCMYDNVHVNNEYSLIIFFNYILTLMLKLSHPPLEPDILIYNKRRDISELKEILTFTVINVLLKRKYNGYFHFEWG